ARAVGSRSVDRFCRWAGTRYERLQTGDERRLVARLGTQRFYLGAQRHFTVVARIAEAFAVARSARVQRRLEAVHFVGLLRVDLRRFFEGARLLLARLRQRHDLAV